MEWAGPVIPLIARAWIDQYIQACDVDTRLDIDINATFEVGQLAIGNWPHERLSN